MSEKNHPYQILDPSPWPIAASLTVLFAAIGGVLAMHGIDHWLLIMSLVFLVIFSGAWWYDVIKESNTPGIHTTAVQKGIRIGMVLFITSEILFFAAFFGSYFYSSLMPTEATGGVWPPKNIITLDPFHLPYLNTLILLLSGTTVTWAHHALLENNRRDLLRGLIITIILGLTFTCVQVYEYGHTAFSIKDGVYGSNFYMATGFHGLHVVIGTIFLIVCAVRAYKGEFSLKAHLGFEAAAWYWHFVDVVWLFLFVSIYWWGYRPLS